MNIKVVYFAYLIPEKWKSIVIEQLDSLYNITELYEKSEIFMSIIDETEGQTELEELRILLSEKYSKIQLMNIFNENVYEYPGIKTVYELSTNSDNEYILYFHSKGVTSNADSTRKCLFKYTIECYKDIIEEMEKDSTIDISSFIPCAYGYGYYNFWWARSSYIYKHCSKPELSNSYMKHSRFTWEMWLGSHYSNKRFIKTYSPILKYNNVYDEYAASDIMYNFENNYIIQNLDNEHFNDYIKYYTKPMNEIADNNLTDKNTAHSYFDTYEKLFTPIRKTASNILEIGIYTGGSIQLWRDFFINAQIYAVDICDMDFIQKNSIKNDDHITLFTNTNGYDDNFIQQNFINNNIKFDLIVDDGPHSLQSVIECVIKYSQLLTDNGILVIEDIQDYNFINILKNQYVPEDLKKYIEVYDLRSIKCRYDDILFVINKNRIL